jgi:DNA-binding beta-propeller fold protein YncE
MTKNRRTRLLPALGAAFALAASALTFGAPGAHGAAELSLVPKAIIGGPGHAGLYGWGAATMCNGDILVGDYWNMRVQRFHPDGTFVENFIDNPGFGDTQHQAPYGLAVDPDSCDVYMADTDRRQVDRYDQDGTFLNSLGQNGVIGETPSTFRYASRVAVEDGLVFVADTWAHRISVWAPNGTQQLWELKGFGAKPGQIKSPHGMSFDSKGRLHVVDSGNKRISVFTVDKVNKRLVFAFTYGAPYDPLATNPAPDAVMRGDLRGIAIDPVNDVSYVVDAEGNRLHKFTIDGTFMSSFGAGKFSDGGREATVDHDGNVWVGDMPQFQVQKFSPAGAQLGTYPNPAQPPPPGRFNSPRGAAVDPVTGNIFVSDTYNFRIQKLAPNGTMLKEWGSRGRSEFEFNYARMIAVHPNGQWLVLADTDNHRVKAYDSDGTFLWEKGTGGTGPGEFKNLHGVDVGADGKVYVADTNNSRVQVLDANGNHLLTFGTVGTADGQFRRPRGIAVDDSNGQIYVADATRKNVQVFSATGSYLRTIGPKAPAGLAMGGPFDVEVDGTYLYVADTPRNKIVVWDKLTGRWVGEYGGAGVVSGKLNMPQGLDLVGDMLYITEQNNERISKWQVVSGEVTPDTTKPQTTVTSPTADQTLTSRPVAIEGTASDAGGVARVQVAVKEQGTGGRFWNAATRTWQTAASWTDAVVAVPGATTTTWSATFDDSASPSAAGAYIVQKRGTDSSGNVEAVVGTKFKVVTSAPDTEAPTSVIGSPQPNGVVTGRPVTVTGTAQDNSGVSSVQVAIQHRTSKEWWNPVTGTWVATLTPQSWGNAELTASGAASTGWSFVFDDTSAPRSDGLYRVQKRAKDAAGNTEPITGFGFSVKG